MSKVITDSRAQTLVRIALQHALDWLDGLPADADVEIAVETIEAAMEQRKQPEQPAAVRALLLNLARRLRAARKLLKKAERIGDQQLIVHHEGAALEAWNSYQAAKAIAGAKAALEQAAAEPVAWGNFKMNGTCVGLSQHPEDIERWINPKPLYTAPQRQPLTDEQVTQGVFDSAVGACASLAVAFRLGVRWAERTHNVTGGAA